MADRLEQIRKRWDPVPASYHPPPDRVFSVVDDVEWLIDEVDRLQAEVEKLRRMAFWNERTGDDEIGGQTSGQRTINHVGNKS